MLLFNPLLFRYDLGFQLSFLATLGILWVVPYYERFAPEGLITKKLGEVLVMTFAVELFVLPVILFSFHTFSPLVIIGNFLVFLVPLAMMISFGAVLLFFIFPGAHLLFAWVSFGLLTTMTRSVEWLGSFRGASITAESFGLWALIGWYLALGILVAGLGRLYAEKTYGQKP
jgi:competence protein ComEC